MKVVDIHRAPAAGSIYDWNERERRAPPAKRPGLLDETLRDGLQSPSVRTPTVEEKMELVRMMSRLGIDAVNLGLPGAGVRAREDVERLLRFMVEERLPIRANCAARTVLADIEPIVEISQRVGAPIEVTAFVGSSPIRATIEEWTLARLREWTRVAMETIVAAGLPASFVTEDTTRSHPAVLEELFRTAIEAGATRLVLCDTCGHATPEGVRSLVDFTRGVVRALGAEERVLLDWHGHNDRGQALATALAALDCGVDRVHGCGLGIGERVGNTSMDLLLLNLFLQRRLDARHDVSGLVEYVRKVSESTGVAIPPMHPLSGSDAFRTATGVHAAAVLKAELRGERELADRVYSSVPAQVFGRRQEIEVGPASGRSNVVWWLREHGHEPDDELVAHLLACAKAQDRVLRDDELQALVRGATRRLPARRADAARASGG